MITLLSGGTGTPKLLQGLTKLVKEEELTVVVNTAEDHWLPHGYFSPDVDTVVYTLAGMVDTLTWHGIKGDTHHTHGELKRFDTSEYLRIGDWDRALHIWRGKRMKKGERLSELTEKHCDILGVKARVIPMSNDIVKTVIETAEGEMDLHEFWVKRDGEVEVEKVWFKGLNEAGPCEQAIDAIGDADRIIIGPSNPVTSINPILSVPGMRKELNKNKKKVVCISPLVGGKVFSGPAEKLMKAFSIEVSAKGVAEFYKDILSQFIVDSTEDLSVLGNIHILKTDISMDTLEKRKNLAKFVLDVVL